MIWGELEVSALAYNALHWPCAFGTVVDRGSWAASSNLESIQLLADDRTAADLPTSNRAERVSAKCGLKWSFPQQTTLTSHSQ